MRLCEKCDVMPDFDLNKQFDDGLSFKRIFRNILVYSISLFVAFYWQGLLNEIITTYIPKGTGLSAKIGIGVVVTIFMVGFAYMIVRRNKNGETNDKD